MVLVLVLVLVSAGINCPDKNQKRTGCPSIPQGKKSVLPVTAYFSWFGREGKSPRQVALEHKLIGARASTLAVGADQFRLHHVDIPFVIGGDLVSGRMVLREPTTNEPRTSSVLRFRMYDDRSPSDVQKPLVRREGRRPGLQGNLLSRPTNCSATNFPSRVNT